MATISKPKNRDFHFKKLSDFQQLLFRETQVKILLRNIAKKHFEVGVLTTEVQRLNYDKNQLKLKDNETEYVKQLKENIAGERTKKERYRKLYHETLEQVRILTKDDKSIIETHYQIK